MTDEELIARLRSNIFGTGTTMLAADRIEALTAKLAKAVEALEVIRDRQYYRMGPGVTAQVIARATLAEIKGDAQ